MTILTRDAARALGIRGPFYWNLRYPLCAACDDQQGGEFYPDTDDGEVERAEFVERCDQRALATVIQLGRVPEGWGFVYSPEYPDDGAVVVDCVPCRMPGPGQWQDFDIEDSL
jgi:hypothetical protein